MFNLILFHHFKHHLGFLKAWVGTNAGNISDEVISAIKTLGSSQLDMYCGALTVEEIIQQSASFLQQQGIGDTAQFMQWVGDGYKLFTLTDGSSFTMRYIDHTKPVHIHPSRHAQHTLRLKANALKTAACYVIAYGNTNNIVVQALNVLRRQYLGLSPIAEKTAINEIVKAIALLGAGSTA